MNTNITKTWEINIDSDEVFSRCTNETLFQTYSRSANPKGDMAVMQDDDKEQFNIYFAVAIAHLGMLLARRMSQTADYASGSFTLDMHDNHDDNIKPILLNHCYEYVTKKVLEQWYHADFGSELERLDINHCIHYRKHPVRRRIGPLF